MTKNIKRMFFVLTLITLLVTVGSVCAADDANTTAAVDSSVSDVATVSETASDTVAAEPVTTKSNDNKVDTKTIEKEEKNLKKDTTTVNVTNYNTLYNAIRDANDENLIINLQTGDYYGSRETWSFNNENVKHITINGNNNSLTGPLLTLSTSYEFEINNLNIQKSLTIENIQKTIITSSTISSYEFTNNGNITLINTTRASNGNSYNNGNMTIINSLLNGTLQNNADATLTIDDDTTFGSNFGINGAGTITTNKTILPYMKTYVGNITIENCELTGTKTNEGNLTLNNVTLKASLTNNGNLNINNSFVNSTVINNGNITISDDTELGTGFRFNNNNGNILSDVNRLLPYFTTYNGNFTIENITFNSGSKTNNGNITIINSNISSKFTNNGNLSFKNSTLNGIISNKGVVIIDDDCVFENNFNLQGNGQVIINDTSRLAPYLNEYRGNYTIINTTVTGLKNNYGNLTYINSTINNSIYNNQPGNLTFINSFINGTIDCGSRNTITIFDDNCTFGEGFRLNGGYGLVIINDSSKLIPYLMYSIPNGNFTIEDYNLSSNLQNFGNTTIVNSNVIGTYTNPYEQDTAIINSTTKVINNNGNMYIYNSTLNGTLTNNQNGYLVIDDNTVFAEGFYLNNYGTLIINDTNKVYPYLTSFNGTNHLSNITIAKRITNYGNLTLSNVTINYTIANLGTLIIDDDVIFGENTNFVSTGPVIINDSNRIYPYLDEFHSDVVFTNINISKTLYNYANLTVQNCTLNSTINNQGTVIISDDTTFSENFLLTGNGEIIINDTSRILPYLNMTSSEIELADSIVGVQYSPTTITAYVTDIYGYNLNGGSVVFKDETGNILAETTVTNGVATATATFQKSAPVTIVAEYTPTNIIITGSSTTGVIEIQSPQTTITIEEITASAGETVTIKATLTDQQENTINGGKVSFKVNGKTVKDANGKVVYAKVVDGVATAEYTVPTNLGGKDITITAVYSGTSKYTKTNTTTTLTVENAVPTLTTSDITATAGSTITLTATITDNGKQVNTGKIVFKINGKTVKDANGKVIYAKIVNGQVSVEYTLPENMKVKEYNLTATFISSEYDRLEDTKTLTVN